MYITAKELAQKLGITTQTVHNLINQGKIPAGVKIGRSRRWNSEKIKQWLEGLENLGGQE